jgi:hypothetical protein
MLASVVCLLPSTGRPQAVIVRSRCGPALCLAALAIHVHAPCWNVPSGSWSASSHLFHPSGSSSCRALLCSPSHRRRPWRFLSARETLPCTGHYERRKVLRQITKGLRAHQGRGGKRYSSNRWPRLRCSPKTICRQYPSGCLLARVSARARMPRSLQVHATAGEATREVHTTSLIPLYRLNASGTPKEMELPAHAAADSTVSR